MNNAFDGFSDRSEATIESPVNIAHRERLLQEVRTMYREWMNADWRYEWHETDDPWDNSGALHFVEMVEAPSITEWLHEYTGERRPTYMPGCGWEYPTFEEEVFDIAMAIVWGAFSESFGPEWQDHGDLDDAACQEESELYRWLEERLKEDECEERIDWNIEGF